MDVVKILPPLMIGEKEVDIFVNALDATWAVDGDKLSGSVKAYPITPAKPTPARTISPNVRSTTERRFVAQAQEGRIRPMMR